MNVLDFDLLRTGFGALLPGVHDKQVPLQYAGNVGTGFNENVLETLKKVLDAKARSTSPFAVDAKIAGEPQRVAPTLVAEVNFGEWTRTGHIRHAVFRGLRADKAATAVVREKALGVSTAASTNAGTVTASHTVSNGLGATTVCAWSARARPGGRLGPDDAGAPPC